MASDGKQRASRAIDALRPFAAIIYLSATSLSACAVGLPHPTAMPTGLIMAQPIGAMLFCAAHATECAGKPEDATRVELTDERLKLLREVQYEVNRAIDPTGRVEVAWHYAANGKGTCVQYAMEKRRRLIALGWPASALQLAIATTRQVEGHLVFVVGTTEGELVLDNLRQDVTRWQVLPYRWIARQHGGSMSQWVSIDAGGNAYSETAAFTTHRAG